MGKVNHQIKNNFQHYKELKDKRKTALNKEIEVKNFKENHKTFKVGSIPVSHNALSQTLNLEVEVKIDNSKDFKFKLFSRNHFGCPIFRFDSAGVTHRNYDPDIPLKDQQVTTPHFHLFNEKGIEIAYKTDALRRAKDQKKLEDINLCIMHFCDEGNIRVKKNEFPEVILYPGELGLTFTNDDPLTNINFS